MINTYLELSLLIDLVASVCFSLIFALIKIPRSDYSRGLCTSKQFLSGSFAAIAAVLWFTLYHRDVADFPRFATLMMLVVTAVSAVVMSYSLISLLDEKFMGRDLFLINVIIIAALGIALARVYLHGHLLATKVLTCIFVAAHVLQCVYHILRFNTIYVRSRKRFKDYYDEDDDRRIRWIRFCYIIMMLTDMFILVYMGFYLLFQRELIIVVYVLFYSLFMLYFSSNYISFLSSHKILLDAFAHETLDITSRQPARRVRDKNKEARKGQAGLYASQDEAREKEFKRISKALSNWVAEKRFREYDKSRDEIAGQLNTTKEMLQLYFSVCVGEDFRSWRTALRIEDAKKLLLEDRKASTNVIAEICGFSDRSNFHRQFSHIVGCSPKEWRESEGHPENLS